MHNILPEDGNEVGRESIKSHHPSLMLNIGHLKIVPVNPQVGGN
jgi:hypothetical protein